MLQYFRRMNQFRKSQKFRNFAYNAVLKFSLAFAFIQLIFFFKPLPNFGKKGAEVDQGET